MNRKAGFILGLVLNSVLLTAQTAQKKIDSLELLLANNPVPAQEIRIINKLVPLRIESNLNQAVDLSKRALELIPHVSDSMDIATAHNHAAAVNSFISDYEESLRQNFKAIAIWEARNDSMYMAFVYNNIGVAYTYLGDYSSAVHYSLRSLEILEKKDVKEKKVPVYVTLATHYMFLSQYDAALTWARKAMQVSYQVKDLRSLAFSHKIMGEIFTEKLQPDSAFHHARLARGFAKQQNNEHVMIGCSLIEGKNFYTQKNYDSAHYHLSEAIRVSDKKRYSDILIPAWITLAKCDVAEKKLAKATEHAQHAYEGSLTIRNRKFAMESATLLADLYAAQNRLKEAYKFQRIASLTKDTIMLNALSGSAQAQVLDLDLEREKKNKIVIMATLAEKEKLVTYQRLTVGFSVAAMLCLIMVIGLVYKTNLDRKIVNEELTKNNKRLEGLNEEINGLINTLVHDLKGPLNSMFGLFKLIEFDLKGNKELEVLLQRGYKVLEGGNTLIRQLLQLREAEQIEFHLTITKIKLPELFSEMEKRFREEALQKNIKIIVNTSPDEIESDKTALSRILDNLVSNALKFSRPETQVTVNAEVINDKLKVEVKDQGPGFHPEDIQKVFGKFQRLRTRPTAGESSSGLGLSIVKVLTQHLRGTVKLHTEWRKGSTFEVVIPTKAK